MRVDGRYKKIQLYAEPGRWGERGHRSRYAAAAHDALKKKVVRLLFRLYMSCGLYTCTRTCHMYRGEMGDAPEARFYDYVAVCTL